MDITQSLNQAINSFNINVDGVQFWAPYLRNDNYTQDPSVPRGLGKSTAAEITESAKYIKSIFPDADAETVRHKLIDGSLPDPSYNYKAIECSGFVYHVMETVYQEILGKHLMDDLSVPKSHVLNGAYNLEEWKAAYALSPAEAELLPEDVPMKWVVENFKRKPVNLCRVAGLVSDYSSIKVESDDLKIGDLIHMNTAGDPIPHSAIISEISENDVSIAHSSRRDPSDIGGVSIEILPLADGLPDTTKMNTPHDFIAVRRLRSLNR